MRSIFVVFLFVAAALPGWASTSVLFSADPQTSFTVGPFPSNSATVPDLTQLTGLRINLPAAENNCDPTSNSVCGSEALLNQLDGFSVNPRLMICFSGPIDPTTLSSGLVIQPLDGSVPVSVNQLLYDNGAQCAYAKPNSVLAQHARYLLLVTPALKDAQHHSVKPDRAFTDCLNSSSEYCEALVAALAHNDISTQSVVAASLFTTLSATRWVEQVRRIVDAVPLATHFPAGDPNTFQLDSVQSIVWTPANGSTPGPQPIPLTSLTGVAAVSFGLFLSPNYISPTGPTAGTIPQTPTALPPNFPNAFLPVSYHVFLPPSAPSGKVPVVIYGHGLGDNQFGAPTYIASVFAQHGLATLALEITGHGFGDSSYTTVTDKNGNQTNLWTPGRGVQLAPGTPIGPTDGCVAPGTVGVRDCLRQTAIDLFALVNTIRATNGLGLNLDSDRIYYVGQSLGSLYGTLFQATEPAVRVAALEVDGGSSVDVARLGVTGKPLGLLYLNSANPALLNDSPAGTFVDSYPFRDQITTPAPGAVPIQAAFEALDWLSMLGDPLSFSTHLRSSNLLAGVPNKSTFFQFGTGDLEVPNPTESALVRAADAFQSTSYLHFEKAVAIDGSLAYLGLNIYGFPILPHRILSNPTLADPTNYNEQIIANAIQQQTADYFGSNGTVIDDANQYLTGAFAGVSLFEPITSSSQLPDRLNFLTNQ